MLCSWGRELFSHSDVVVISELSAPWGTLWDTQYLQVMSVCSGLQYYRAAFGNDPTFPEVGILSRYPLSSVQVTTLVGDKEALDASIVVDGRRVRILGTHLTPAGYPRAYNADRMASVNKIISILATETAPTIVAGDFNTCAPVSALQAGSSQGRQCHEFTIDTWGTAEGIEYSQMKTVFRDAYQAVPGAYQESRIDYVFYRGGLRVIDFETGLPQSAFLTSHPVSDHPFVVATFVIEPLYGPPPSVWARSLVWTDELAPEVNLGQLDNSANMVGLARYRPRQGWTPVAADNSRVMWQNTTTGEVHLWTLDSFGDCFSNSAWQLESGWRAMDYVGGRVLLKNVNGAVQAWRLAGDTSLLAVATFGPYLGWGVVNYAQDRLLLRDVNGSAMLWTLNGNYQIVGSRLYTAVSGRTALGYDDGVLYWRYPNGVTQRWSLYADGSMASSRSSLPVLGSGFDRGVSNVMLWRGGSQMNAVLVDAGGNALAVRNVSCAGVCTPVSLH